MLRGSPCDWIGKLLELLQSPSWLYYSDSDWDISTILRNKRYYFKQSERNRRKKVQWSSIILTVMDL